MNDPYKILGVSPDASDEDIKTAYRALARKYHPDKYRDSDLAEMAGEKMKEINAAYDEIQKIRAGKAQGGQSTGGYGNPYGSYGGGSSNPYIVARQLINLRRVGEAAQILASIPENERSAEWYFLMGCVAVGHNHFADAQHFFDTACGMDPGNTEYANARERLYNRGNGFGSGQSSNAGCSVCDICTAFMCADCCCDMGRCLC